jgi:diphthine-ammonia ligase
MSSPKKAAILYTGGKDSTFAIEKIRQNGFDVTCLVSIKSENSHSYMLHTPNIGITELTAKALDLPIIFGVTRGVKEEELLDIESTLREARKSYSFDYIGSGGLCSEYQRSRLERIAHHLGVGSLVPLWGMEQREYVQNLVKLGYEFILTSVAAGGLNARWLGLRMDEDAIRELLGLSDKFHFNPAFEGGEAETLVLDCPLYLKNRLSILESEREWDGVRGTLRIKKAKLSPKKN